MLVKNAVLKTLKICKKAKHQRTTKPGEFTAINIGQDDGQSFFPLGQLTGGNNILKITCYDRKQQLKKETEITTFTDPGNITKAV